MDFLKSFTMTWWQVAMFKLCLLSLGIVVGVTWSKMLFSWVPFFLFVFLVCGGYITVLWARQR